jgi:hypothetical protein
MLQLINYPTRGVCMIASFEYDCSDEFPPLMENFLINQIPGTATNCIIK